MDKNQVIWNRYIDILLPSLLMLFIAFIIANTVCYCNGRPMMVTVDIEGGKEYRMFNCDSLGQAKRIFEKKVDFAGKKVGYPKKEDPLGYYEFRVYEK